MTEPARLDRRHQRRQETIEQVLDDAVFERGWRLLGETMERLVDSFDGTDPVGEVHAHGTTFVRWAVEHPAYAPLMFWRPVPGFAPSEQAYAPAVALWETGRQWMADLQAVGVLRPDVDLRRAYRAWTAVTGGVITQQL